MISSKFLILLLDRRARLESRLVSFDLLLNSFLLLRFVGDGLLVRTNLCSHLSEL